MVGFGEFLSIGELRWNGMSRKLCMVYRVVRCSKIFVFDSYILRLDRFCLSVGSKRVSGS